MKQYYATHCRYTKIVATVEIGELSDEELSLFKSKIVKEDGICFCVDSFDKIPLAEIAHYLDDNFDSAYSNGIYLRENNDDIPKAERYDIQREIEEAGYGGYSDDMWYPNNQVLCRCIKVANNIRTAFGHSDKNGDRMSRTDIYRSKVDMENTDKRTAIRAVIKKMEAFSILIRLEKQDYISNRMKLKEMLAKKENRLLEEKSKKKLEEKLNRLLGEKSKEKLEEKLVDFQVLPMDNETTAPAADNIAAIKEAIGEVKEELGKVIENSLITGLLKTDAIKQLPDEDMQILLLAEKGLTATQIRNVLNPNCKKDKEENERSRIQKKMDKLSK